MKQFILILLFASTVVFEANSQKIIINESPVVTSFVNQYVSKLQSEETITGWRIQIISTDDRRKMEQAKSKFESLYPDIETTWKHMVPYYQVRAGAYESKSKLMAFMLELKEIFPTATPVVDEIPKSDFIR